MKRLLALVSVAATIALAASCSSAGRPSAEEARREQARRIAQGYALVQQQQYDEAMDVFVELAGEKSVRRQAVVGATDALVAKAATQRVPDRVESALDLSKRLPSSTGTRRQLMAAVATVLVDPVVTEARQAEEMLKNRRAFVESMYDEDEGDVRPAPEKRVLTGEEALKARELLPELGVSAEVVRLYRYARPLAAVMDRFAVDDERYLAQEEVTDEQLDEIDRSCDLLERALTPVQRQLDRVRPGWRPQ